MSSEGHKLGKVFAEALQIMRIHPGKLEGRAMRSFDPQTLLLLETAFDEAWLTLKSFGNNTVKPDELARAVFRLAMEDERHPVRLHDGALEPTATRDHPGARRADRTTVSTKVLSGQAPQQR